MAISTDSVLAALKAGTYTLESITASRFFKVKQPENRRRYPSIELIETPLSETAAEEKSDFVRKFDVRIFLGLHGGTTTGQEDDISDLEVLEQEILFVMNNTTLGEHKITIEDKQWRRDYKNEALRPHILSVLTFTIRQVTGATSTPDGILTYVIATSTADNKPVSDYVYTNVYNVDINEGHTDIDESINNTTNPQRFTGDFFGTFIGHIKVSDVDLGATSDKLNELRKIQANGEKQIVSFKFTNKAQNTPTTKTIRRDVKLTIDSINEQYRVGDNTVFRILAKLLEPSATTVI